MVRMLAEIVLFTSSWTNVKDCHWFPSLRTRGAIDRAIAHSSIDLPQITPTIFLIEWISKANVRLSFLRVYKPLYQNVVIYIILAATLCPTNMILFTNIFHRVQLDASISSLVLVDFVTKTLLSFCILGYNGVGITHS